MLVEIKGTWHEADLSSYQSACGQPIAGHRDQVAEQLPGDATQCVVCFPQAPRTSAPRASKGKKAGGRK